MNILIAEDDEVSRRLLRHIIESQPDYKVIEASNGTKASPLSAPHVQLAVKRMAELEAEAQRLLDDAQTT